MQNQRRTEIRLTKEGGDKEERMEGREEEGKMGKGWREGKRKVRWGKRRQGKRREELIRQHNYAYLCWTDRRICE